LAIEHITHAAWQWKNLPMNTSDAYTLESMNPEIEQTSSYASGALSVFQMLQQRGIDGNQVLADAGLELAQFRVSGARINTETFCRYIQLAYERCADYCFGLHAADFIHPTSYHALGLALLSSSTLRSYLGRWERYYSFITTHANLSLTQEMDGACLEYNFFGPQDDYPGAARVMRDANLSLVVKFIRFMYRPDYQPMLVELIDDVPSAEKDTYRTYLGSDIEFRAGRNAIWVANVDLDKPLPAANAELARQNDQVVVEFLARMDRANVPAQVRAKLIELLPSGDCSKTKVATALFMSVRTLHNRLAQADTNYQQLLDDTRRELAEQYMKQPSISISEVGYILGFSDCSNFSRAFQRWTGKSPSQFRDTFQDLGTAS
jgi:AraC-like DNA-binding protein